MGRQFEGFVDSFPEHGRSREDLLARARQLAWYHTLTLDETFTTQGLFALDDAVPYYLLPESLAGLDCLEIGTGNGYWSFQMEQRGARSVTATDIGAYIETDFSRIHGQPSPCAGPSPDGAYGEPFRLAASLLGSRVRYRITSVYDLRPGLIGAYDLVFCGSMLMHLYGPLLALQRMADVCRDTLLLTTQTDIARDGEAVTAFVGHQVPYVHFVPSPSCLVDMVRCCGYEQVLRGPTFQLWLRDREQSPEPIVHTSLIASKDAARSSVTLPPARRYRGSERTARIEVVHGPRRVHPGELVDLTVSIENLGGVAWRSSAEYPLRLEWETRAGSEHESALTRQQGGPSAAPLPDYLPSGLSTLARLRVRAPARSGPVSVRPILMQGAERFDTNEVGHEFLVDPGYRGPDKPSRWLSTAQKVIRRLPGYAVARRTGSRLIARLH